MSLRISNVCDSASLFAMIWTDSLSHIIQHVSCVLHVCHCMLLLTSQQVHGASAKHGRNNTVRFRGQSLLTEREMPDPMLFSRIRFVPFFIFSNCLMKEPSLLHNELHREHICFQSLQETKMAAGGAGGAPELGPLCLISRPSLAPALAASLVSLRTENKGGHSQMSGILGKLIVSLTLLAC